MQINNIHIIVGLIIIIIIIFIYNYDIHVTPKGEKLCNDVLIDKKNMSEIKNQNKISIIDKKENNVINNVMKVLENIPSDMDQDIMLSIVHKLNELYQNSKNIDEFNTKLLDMPDEYPYNTKYAKLVSNLIIKFDNEEILNTSNNNTNNTSNISNKDNIEKYNILKKSKKKNKKVSFDETHNTSRTFEKYEEIIKEPEHFSNVGEFNNYAPF